MGGGMNGCDGRKEEEMDWLRLSVSETCPHFSSLHSQGRALRQLKQLTSMNDLSKASWSFKCQTLWYLRRNLLILLAGSGGLSTQAAMGLHTSRHRASPFPMLTSAPTSAAACPPSPAAPQPHCGHRTRFSTRWRDTTSWTGYVYAARPPGWGCWISGTRKVGLRLPKDHFGGTLQDCFIQVSPQNQEQDSPVYSKHIVFRIF